MHDVEPYRVGPRFKTDLWVDAKRVAREMKKIARKKRDLVNEYQALTDRAATIGFDDLPDTLFAHFDWQVYTLGNRQGSLFRGAGFFDSKKPKQTFLMMDFYEKHGQHYRLIEREKIIRVAQIRNEGSWRYTD
ncbi:MAG: hypothetical protein HY287_15280 [Planctomycetes bacterium]|nr:hypothetical protein [Planctomycetota bacterium]MBI3835686.1 hypothetical protein [Planctomycetota bacterium]